MKTKKLLESMRSWLPVMLIAFGSLWLFQAALAHTSSHGVIVRGLNYNAGTVKEGTVVHHIVRIVNLSADPVEVDAQPSCGCTVASVPQTAISPFHTGQVLANVDTQGLGSGNEDKAIVFTMRTNGALWQVVGRIRFKLS